MGQSDPPSHAAGRIPRSRGTLYSLLGWPTVPRCTPGRKCGRRSDHGPGTPPNGLKSATPSGVALGDGKAGGVEPRCAAETRPDNARSPEAIQLRRNGRTLPRQPNMRIIHRREVDVTPRTAILVACESADQLTNWEDTMGQTIQLKASDGFTLDAYTAGPANATKGIVVIQEIFGVNHHIRDMADRLAAAGYAVVAPAVYDRVEKRFDVGYTPEDIAKGRDVRMKLEDKQLMLDVEAAAAHLKGKKLGIVGYCFGGTVAWWGATRSTSFFAAVAWYGGGGARAQ